MPLYEYKCRKCASVLEVIQKVSDSPLTECPKCGGRLKKVLSAPAIQFKGSGFYITDYTKTKKPERKDKHTKKSKDEKTKATKGKDDSQSSHSD
jgi:putative FmdB family regulatory protein